MLTEIKYHIQNPHKETVLQVRPNETVNALLQNDVKTNNLSKINTLLLLSDDTCVCFVFLETRGTPDF